MASRAEHLRCAMSIKHAGTHQPGRLPPNWRPLSPTRPMLRHHTDLHLGVRPTADGSGDPGGVRHLQEERSTRSRCRSRTMPGSFSAVRSLTGGIASRTPSTRSPRREMTWVCTKRSMAWSRCDFLPSGSVLLARRLRRGVVPSLGPAARRSAPRAGCRRSRSSRDPEGMQDHWGQAKVGAASPRRDPAPPHAGAARYRLSPWS